MDYGHIRTKEMKEWLVDKTCARCGDTQELTIDHIIPVGMLLNSFGAKKEETYDYDNFQALCRRCNTAKGGWMDVSNPKTKPLLIKYANKYCR